jgi:hypothetical protein
LHIHAQTFTAGHTGILKRIDAPISPPASGALSWDVRRTTNGVPSDEVLAAGFVPSYTRTVTNSYFEWFQFSLPEPGIPVVQGDVLAFTLYNPREWYVWWSGSGGSGPSDPYVGGAYFALRGDGSRLEVPTADVGFRTYLEVPSLPAGYPQLSIPTRAAGQWQFSVSGDSDHVYVFERSSDLQLWHLFFTNALRTPIRTVAAMDSGAAWFYRARTVPRRKLFAILSMNDIERDAHLQTDSFDSSDATFSTNGQYDSAKRKAGGDIALFGNMVATQRLVQICGTVWLSRHTTNFFLPPTGSVGDLTWVSGGNYGIQPGWLRQDLHGLYPTPRPPSGPALTPSGGIVAGEAYTYVLNDGFWKLDSLSLNSTNKMLIVGDTTLWVPGDISLWGQALIRFHSADARLKLYVGGYASFGGGGIIGLARPANFIYYGLASNYSLDISATPFTGVIYAPKTECILRSGGRNSFELLGSCTVRNLRLSGSVAIHFDESLQDQLLD